MTMGSTDKTLKREGRMLAYSLAAGASAMAAGQADAAIQYSGIQNIGIGLGFYQNLDLDGDFFQDIKLKNYNYGTPYQGATVIYGPGQLVGFQPGLAYVSALTAGETIDAGTVGPTFFGSMGYAANPQSEFDNATDAYIGLSFPSGPNLYYGWIRVDIDSANGTFLIKDWAYEDVSGVGIEAGAVPEPGALSLLAAGAAGVTMLRRRRQA